MSTTSKGIQVVVRFRPLNDAERADSARSAACVELRKREIQVLDEFNQAPVNNNNNRLGAAAATAANVDQQKQFTFDEVFDQSAQQEDLFESVGKPVVTNVIKGYNGTILAYGQTGSGKTHSMLGPEGGTLDVLSANSPHLKYRGVIPRLIEELFRRLSSVPTEEMSYKVSCSVFELYKENIVDLLTEGPQQKEYRIREDSVGGRGVYVENLYAKQCLSAPELLEAVRVGVSRRKVASTKANDTSSRSHSLTVITVEQVNHVQGGTVTKSRLNLIDLAGSEKIARTHAEGDRLEEAKQINKSLTFLGMVIKKLTDGSKGYVPYRDSKLTRILQDSLGGNSMTTLLCHCSPAMYNRDETLGTLRFAARAKQIKNAPKVNKELSQKELEVQLAIALERIRTLEERLAVQSDIQQQQELHGSATRPRTSERQLNRSHHEDPDDGVSAEEDDDAATAEGGLKAILDSLMRELEDVKRDLAARDEELAERTQQLEFHRQRSSDAEVELQEQQARWRRDEGLLQRRLAEKEADNQRLLQQLQIKAAVLLDGPALCGADVTAPSSVGKRVHQAPVLGATRPNALRKTTADAQRMALEGPEDARRASLQGMEVVGSGASAQSSAVVLTPVSAHPSTFTPQTPVGDNKNAKRTSATQQGRMPSQHRASPVTPLSAQNRNDALSVAVPAVEVLELLGGQALEPTTPATPLGGELSARRLSPVRPPIETCDVGVTALVGKSDAELQKEIDDVQSHVKLLMSKSATLNKSVTDANDRIAKLNDLLEEVQTAKDNALQERDSQLLLLGSKDREIAQLRDKLNTQSEENEFLKRIMAELDVNLSDFRHLLSGEKQRAEELASEAEGLRQNNYVMRKTAEQQEFVEMASMELLVKSEDMEAVEQDLRIMATLPTEEIFLRKRDHCLQTLRQLVAFLDHLTGQLTGQSFNTGNLESRRLQLLTESATLRARCDDAKDLLKG